MTPHVNQVLPNVDDELASDGKSARMSGNHANWAVQYPISRDIAHSGWWYCYVVIRCKSTQKEGIAFTLGIYDNKSKQDIARITETLDKALQDKYGIYDLGVHRLTTSMSFWIAPPGNDMVDGVYVDRIFLIRGKEPGKNP